MVKISIRAVIAARLERLGIDGQSAQDILGTIENYVGQDIPIETAKLRIRLIKNIFMDLGLVEALTDIDEIIASLVVEGDGKWL